MSRLIHRAASAVALSALLALLMADSAADPCSVAPFDRTYVVTSSCPEYGSETIRIRLDDGPEETRWLAEVEHVSGDQVVTEAVLYGSCGDEGDPAEYFHVDLTLIELDGDGPIDCNVSLTDGSSYCYDSSCTLLLEEVEARR